VVRSEDLSIDSYAYRGLVSPPTSVQVLSSLATTPDRFLQRCGVVTSSGEEMTLVLRMKRQEALEARYRGLRCVQKWFLEGMEGEPADSELPTAPHCRHGPEVVVRAQLEALK
jgi:hypothetical protein